MKLLRLTAWWQRGQKPIVWLKRFAMKNVDERVAAVQLVRLIRYAVHSWPPPETRNLRFRAAIPGQKSLP